VHVGPVVDQSQLEQDLRYIKIGQDEGARLAGAAEIWKSRDARFLVCSRAVHGDDNRCASRARKFRPRRLRYPAPGLRWALAIANDYRFRPCGRGLHHQPEICLAFQAATARPAWYCELPTAGVDITCRSAAAKVPAMAREQGLCQGVLHAVKTANLSGLTPGLERAHGPIGDPAEQPATSSSTSATMSPSWSMIRPARGARFACG